jgi:hypothetical protein
MSEDRSIVPTAAATITMEGTQTKLYADDHQDEDDDQHQRKKADRTATPILRVGPSARDRADHHYDQNDKQDGQEAHWIVSFAERRVAIEPDTTIKD